jgi:hypothetical protein
MTNNRFVLLSIAAAVMAHNSAFAEVETITCVDKQDVSAKVVEFDSRRQEVRMDGLLMRDVIITTRHIKFVHDLGVAGLWPITIDRLTGVMERKIAGNEVPGIPTHLPPMICEKAKHKF